MMRKILTPPVLAVIAAVAGATGLIMGGGWLGVAGLVILGCGAVL